MNLASFWELNYMQLQKKKIKMGFYWITIKAISLIYEYELGEAQQS